MTAIKPIRILLVVEPGLFRASLARLLASEPDFQIVGDARASGELLEAPDSSACNVVVLDFELGVERVNNIIAAAHAPGDRTNVLMVVRDADADNAAMVLKLGASGIFLKSEDPDRLVQAIRRIAEGGIWIDHKMLQVLANGCIYHASHPPDREPQHVLKEREETVLAGIVSGLTNKKIALNMGISESSVKNILQALFYKAGVRTRSQLVRLALEGSLGNPREFKTPAANGLTTDVAAVSASPGPALR